MHIGGYVASAAVFSFIVVLLFTTFFDSPKEKQLQREIANLEMQYKILNGRMIDASAVLAELREKDDDIYRVIFEAEPIPSTVRKAGYGGVNRYQNLEGYVNSEVIVETNEKLDKLTRQLVVQSRSFDEVITLAKSKEEMLSAIPAIQPVANEKLKRVASGFNWRIHPIYKIRHFHTGIDFTATRGTEIYATGDGVVKQVEIKRNGYGKNIKIDHGYGYVTLYAHMSKFNVRKGQKVKRGEVIGYVGTTGTSTAPHLHYEVIKHGQKINPVNFFFNDLSPEEYERVVELSSRSNQSFD
jgi:murein DD-endopeptidase MepM/ murein hydrolase activator NlpD